MVAHCFFDLEGDENQILFSVNKNLDLLKNKIVYARACHAGLFLGKKAVENNDGSFIGYDRPFSFWIDEQRSATPSKDKIAALFLEPSNEIMHSLIKRNNIKKADEKSKKMMVENMRKVLKMDEKKESGAMGWLEILWNNFDGQVICGDEDNSF